MHIIIWKFEVNPTCKQKFEELYGQNGKWVKLFKKAKGYIGTDLTKEVSQENWYLTIDKWQSKGAYENFLKDFKKEYDALDTRGEKLTISEVKIGWCEEIGK